MKEFHSKLARSIVRFHDVQGKGNPILFIHGLGCASSCDYPGVISHPSLRGRMCILVDLLGSGFSDRPGRFGYTVHDHARVLRELIVSSGIRRLHLYGHSMGGAIAIEIAHLCGERVESLTVSEPNLDSGGGSFSRPIASERESAFVRRGFDAAVSSAYAAGNRIWAASLLKAQGIRVEVVPGAGHSMAWENPAGLARCIGRSVRASR
jgi:pimeloyl-ACP methyl ester carboxylesterase